MEEDRFDLNQQYNTDRNPLIVGAERVIAFGVVTTALAMVGNAHTNLGTNPMNYYVAIWTYLYR